MDYQKYLASNHWKEVREKYKSNHCDICAGRNNLHLHHVSYKNLNNETEKDLVTLCSLCHLASHIGLASTAKLKNPSRANANIVRRLKLGVGIKRVSYCIFLRRRYIAEFGDKNIPPIKKFDRFSQLFRYKLPNIKNYRYYVPEDISDYFLKYMTSGKQIPHYKKNKYSFNKIAGAVQKPVATVFNRTVSNNSQLTAPHTRIPHLIT